MIILDTDIFSFLELEDSPEYLRICASIAQLDPSELIAVTVVTFEEQSRGRLASIKSARDASELLSAYVHLRQHISNYLKIRILDFDAEALAEYDRLVKLKLRMGTLDLRIAAICLVKDAALATRNLSDFRKVPGLRAEDWSAP